MNYLHAVVVWEGIGSVQEGFCDSLRLESGATLSFGISDYELLVGTDQDDTCDVTWCSQ